MSLRLKLFLLIFILFATAIGNSAFIYRLQISEDEKGIWIDHTYEVLQNTKRLLSDLQDTETGQRGFLLTLTPSYLQPYYTGLTNSETHFQNLKKLTQDNPNQQERLTEIHRLMALKFSELTETIEITQADGNNIEALKIIRNNKGKEHMDNIRTIIRAFENEENLLLETRKGDFRASKAQINTLILVELVFFVSLAIMTFAFLQKNFFQPLNLLLKSTKKAEEGKRLDILDIVQKDEMGYLLSSFFSMNEKIQKRAKKLDYKAHHDELTGLKNRAKMYEEIEDVLAESEKSKSKFSIFFIDLNDFKILNDTLGHDAGDSMLIEVAKRLESSVRGIDSVFRIGGDEFLILINNVKNKREVEKIVSNVFSKVESPILIQGQPTQIKLSVGVAIGPDDAKSVEELIQCADVAMYEAKEGKKDKKNKKDLHKFFDKSMLKRSGDIFKSH